MLTSCDVFVWGGAGTQKIHACVFYSCISIHLDPNPTAKICLGFPDVITRVYARCVCVSKLLKWQLIHREKGEHRYSSEW